MVSPAVDVCLLRPALPSQLYEPSNSPSSDFESIVLTNAQILERVCQMANDISQDYRGRRIQPVVVMNGAYRFFCDLSARLTGVIEGQDPLLISIKSYLGVQSSGQYAVKIHPQSKVNESVLNGSDVLVTEDIVETGGTLDHLRMILRGHGAASVCVASLLDKPDARKVHIDPDLVKYIGFRLPADRFVVGYGMDYDGQLRDEPNIGVLSPQGRERVNSRKLVSVSCSEDWID